MSRGHLKSWDFGLCVFVGAVLGFIGGAVLPAFYFILRIASEISAGSSDFGETFLVALCVTLVALLFSGGMGGLLGLILGSVYGLVVLTIARVVPSLLNKVSLLFLAVFLASLSALVTRVAIDLVMVHRITLFEEPVVISIIEAVIAAGLSLYGSVWLGKTYLSKRH